LLARIWPLDPWDTTAGFPFAAMGTNWQRAVTIQAPSSAGFFPSFRHHLTLQVEKIEQLAHLVEISRG